MDNKILHHLKTAQKKQFENDIASASESYRMAYTEARNAGDKFLIRVAAYNRGLCLLQQQKAKQSISLLKKAFPDDEDKSKKQNDDLSIGNIYQYLGVAYEMLKNDDKAITHYEVAMEQYKQEPGKCAPVSEVAMRLGRLYKAKQNHYDAGRCYRIAVDHYKEQIKEKSLALALCCLATECLEDGMEEEEALKAAHECVQLCQKLARDTTLVNIYNELGMVYSRCGRLIESCTCFELAVPLAGHDSSEKAAILQNLGAVYCMLQHYQKAIDCGENAKNIYEHLPVKNYSAISQCHLNMAYAYGRLNSFKLARKCYQNVLDSREYSNYSKHKWVALEGLGVVASNMAKIDEAQSHFQKALACVPESNKSANIQSIIENIVIKTTVDQRQPTV